MFETLYLILVLFQCSVLVSMKHLAYPEVYLSGTKAVEMLGETWVILALIPNTSCNKIIRNIIWKNLKQNKWHTPLKWRGQVHFLKLMAKLKRLIFKNEPVFAPKLYDKYLYVIKTCSGNRCKKDNSKWTNLKLP